MSTIAGTRMSLRGQVVTPQSVREEAGFKPGDQFDVMRHNGPGRAEADPSAGNGLHASAAGAGKASRGSQLDTGQDGQDLSEGDRKGL
jgi:bifunctional DNA-binding transcriptional regulator/antitoxin component of YhaV-PrlF toxin-antitoxin module